MNNVNWQELHEKLMLHFRLRAVPVAVKYFKTIEEAKKIPALVFQPTNCSPCMAVGKAARKEECVAITYDNFTNNYCAGVNGMFEKDDKWHSAKPFKGRWHSTMEAAQSHHKALTTFLKKEWEVFATAPLKEGLFEEPDAVILFVNPEQAFWVLTSSVNKDYKKRHFTFCGESTCNDSWITTTMTGEVGLGIGSYGERSYSGLPEDLMMISMKLEDVCKTIEGAVELKKGEGGERLGYPVPVFSLNGDIGEDTAEAFVGY